MQQKREHICDNKNMS